MTEQDDASIEWASAFASPPATPERLCLKKSNSIDLGNLCRRSSSADWDAGMICSGSVRDFAVTAKFSHAMALGRCQTAHRRSLLTGRRESSSSNDLASLGAEYDGSLADYDYLSAPLAVSAVSAPRSHSSASNNRSSSASTSDDNSDDATSFIMKIVGDKRRWTVGRISVFMLVVFTATDFLLNAAGIYIRPTIGIISVSKKNEHVHAGDRPQLSLGAAAISSITETLSPILPFTGGLDLRREDYWKNGLVGSVMSISVQVRDAFSQKEQAPASLRAQHRHPEVDSSSRPKIEIKHALSLSSPSPFVPLTKISDLSLGDMAAIYQYALESTRPSFDRSKFMKSVEPRVRDVLSAFDKATAQSRGAQVQPAITDADGRSADAGSMDALNFCAATRILAEWRVIRQVPEGYKGYAVGMGLGHKDVVQNVAKIEKALHAFIDNRAMTASSSKELRSPTLYEILQHEIDTGVQVASKLPQLQERTAGMGLLWVRRQLQYQNELFTKFLLVGETYDTTNAALNAAYLEVYGKYHGWAVQKIFSYSFQAAPEMVEIFKIMNPHKLKEVSSAPCPESTIRSDATEPDQNSAPKSENMPKTNIFEKAGSVIHKEWDKIASNVVGFFADRFGKKRSKKSTSSVASEGNSASSSYSKEEYIADAMTQDARTNMRIYLAATKPILGSLARLFDELNMNDPRKV